MTANSIPRRVHRYRPGQYVVHAVHGPAKVRSCAGNSISVYLIPSGEDINGRTDEWDELAVDGAAEIAEDLAFMARREFADDVALEAHKLRVREAAKEKVAAEKDDEQIALSEELLNRDQILDLPRQEWLIDGILPKRAYALVSGRRSTYKSFTVQDWAWCLATRRPWFGRKTEQVRVLYVAGEGAHGLSARVDAWERHHGLKVDAEFFDVLPLAVNLYRGGPEFDQLLEIVTAGQYGLVVFDTLRRMSGRADGNSATEMGVVVDRIEQVKRATHDGSVLVVAHTGKSDNDTRGSSAIEDDSDVVWTARADDYRIELRNSKMKDGPDGERIDLKPVKVAESVVLQPFTVLDTPDTSEKQRELLTVMRDMFSEDGATPTELLIASGLKKSTFYAAKNSLERSGLIVNTGSKTRPRLELASIAGSSPVQEPLSVESNDV